MCVVTLSDTGSDRLHDVCLRLHAIDGIIIVVVVYTVVPVSYTHLDVYKRQIYKRVAQFTK